MSREITPFTISFFCESSLFPNRQNGLVVGDVEKKWHVTFGAKDAK